MSAGIADLPAVELVLGDLGHGRKPHEHGRIHADDVVELVEGKIENEAGTMAGGVGSGQAADHLDPLIGHPRGGGGDARALGHDTVPQGQLGDDLGQRAAAEIGLADEQDADRRFGRARAHEYRFIAAGGLQVKGGSYRRSAGPI